MYNLIGSIKRDREKERKVDTLNAGITVQSDKFVHDQIKIMLKNQYQ